MKHFLTLGVFCALAACSQTDQTSSDEPVNSEADTSVVYDAALAKKLGADERGMRNYVFATLLTGPRDAEITDAAERNTLFRGHFANITKLAEEGKLVLAGPFIESAPKRGLYIFNVETIEEAEALVQEDPAIAAGIFKVELNKYYGSAALVQLNDLHLKIQKQPVD